MILQREHLADHGANQGFGEATCTGRHEGSTKRGGGTLASHTLAGSHPLLNAQYGSKQMGHAGNVLSQKKNGARLLAWKD